MPLPVPSIDETIICVSDLHGHIDKLESLWRRLEEQVKPAAFACAKVIFLGDYVDRGPHSREVIAFLLALRERHPQQRHVFLAGNHEFAMCSFIGELPVLSAELHQQHPGFSLRQTWEHEVPYRKGEREAWWKGDPAVEDAMHLQGRRWGGNYCGGIDSIYDAASTFESYGVRLGDREGLLRAMPQSHKDFLRNLDWIHETQLPDGSKLLAVHAGFDVSQPLEEQLERCRNRDYRTRIFECLAGRANVVSTPVELDPSTFLISGHHGFFRQDGRRIIIDEGGGHPNRPLTAVILPGEIFVRSES